MVLLLPSSLATCYSFQPLDRVINDTLHSAFDDPGYDEVSWTLESLITDLQSEDGTFYDIFRLDILLGDFIAYLEDWEAQTGVDTIVDDIRDGLFELDIPEPCLAMYL